MIYETVRTSVNKAGKIKHLRLHQWFFATLLSRPSVTKKVVRKSGCQGGFFASCLFRSGS